MIVLIAASLAFFGWLTGNSAIKSIFLGISPLTAFAFMLVSSALLLLISRKGRLALRVLAGLTVLIGLLRLIELIFGLNTGLDHLFVITSFGSQPIPIAPNTAVALILIGAALLLDNPASARRIVLKQLCALAVLLITTLALAGYVFNLNTLYTFHTLTPMALSTASLFLAVSFSLLAVNFDSGLMTLLHRHTVGGMMMRRLLPVVILVPMIVGALNVFLGNAGFYTDQSDAIVFAALIIVMMASILLVERADDGSH